MNSNCFAAGLMVWLAATLTTPGAETNSPPPRPAIPAPPRVEPLVVFGGKENLEVIRNPASVMAYRIDPHRARTWTAKELVPDAGGAQSGPGLQKQRESGADRKAEIAGYHIIGRPVQLSTNLVGQLTTLWTNAGSFSDAVTHCDFSPGIALKYTRDKRVVVLLICLSCTEVETVVEGKGAGGAKLFPVEEQIKALAKKMFPGDKELKRL
jgi:hypothetical protein